MKDRFTDASLELTANNPYISTDSETRYGHPTITHLDDARGHDRHHEWRGPECTYNCDPMPFGD